MSETTAGDNNQNIQLVNIEDEMRGSYLNYAMSVIVGRALPDVRDGLKPVHRRVLYAMYEMGVGHNKPYKKSARVVGDVIGKYHPHGDSAVYDTVVRLAQDFSLRYPLVDGQGNFGSIDGDSAAAMRYTEVRMEKITNELLDDLEKETVDFGPNYDDSLKEPLVLPTKIPNLLVNGSAGIAVGMATNIPPHNLTEVVDATIALIDNPGLTVDDLLKHVQGPDFPTGAIMFGGSSIREIYRTGRGSVSLRAKTEIENFKGDRERIIVSELPYQVNKAKLIEKIAELVRDKRIEGISDLRDESDRKGMRMVIELKKGENSNVILNQLFKLTQLQESFGINLLAIYQGQPKVFNLKDMLWAFVEHRKDVVIRRTIFDLKKAEARAHILEGLKKAVENIDEVIAIIKAASNADIAKANLIARFEFSEIQAQAILEMRLQRLTGLERDKIVNEYHEVLKLIAHLKEILGSESLVFKIIRDELGEVKESYGDARRTSIDYDANADFEVEDLIDDVETLVTITHSGYVKRTDPSQFRQQNRGGRGVKGMQTVEEDFVTDIYHTTTLSSLFCFTDRGRLYSLKVYKMPEAARVGKGKAIVNLLALQPGEKIKAILPVKEVNDSQFIMMITKKGIIKKTSLSEFGNIMSKGIIAINIDDGDELLSVRVTDGKKDVFLCTEQGMSIRFDEEDVRAMGRATRGVIGISLDEGDRVVAMEVLDRSETTAYEILVVSSTGYGKRTPVKEYRIQSRGGKGILTMKLSDRNGTVMGARQVLPNKDVMLATNKGQLIRINVGGISEQGRVTQGVRLMTLTGDESIVSFETIAESEKPDASTVGTSVTEAAALAPANPGATNGSEEATDTASDSSNGANSTDGGDDGGETVH